MEECCTTKHRLSQDVFRVLRSWQWKLAVKQKASSCFWMLIHARCKICWKEFVQMTWSALSLYCFYFLVLFIWLRFLTPKLNFAKMILQILCVRGIKRSENTLHNINSLTSRRFLRKNSLFNSTFLLISLLTVWNSSAPRFLRQIRLEHVINCFI